MLKYLILFILIFYVPNALAFEILKFNGKVEYVYIIINADDYNINDNRL